MNSKLFGGILLVVGTTIGAGMLALPVATAQLGFWGSIVLLLGSWAIMTACAFLFLEVNLWLPPNSNLISMAGATLGKSGQLVAWVFYTILLYSILCAYIAGGGDLFHYILTNLGIHVSAGIASILFTALFGIIVYFGIRMVDYANRGLMFGKLGALVLLILLIMPYVIPSNLDTGAFIHITSPSTITVVTVAFTSLMIIPSLRTYFGEDVKSLRISIFLGTLIPLICYIAWELVILGVIPFEGTPGLKEMMTSSSSNSDLVSALGVLLHKDNINMLAKFFTAICMATSFLSVSLSLSDFLADGFKVAKKGWGSIFIFAVTFVPPVLIVLFYPDAFMRGLSFAGICCFILMMLLPPLMVWVGRYRFAMSSDSSYQVPGGKVLLVSLMIFATLMLGFGIKGVL